jgi:hypothetical protein
MAHTLSHTFYYHESIGPIRNGEPRHKEEIRPTISGIADYGEMLEMAESIIEWGQHRWDNDHGSYEDHLALINFVNLAIEYMSRFEPYTP